MSPLLYADREGVSFFSLDGPDYDSNGAMTAKELNDFVSVDSSSSYF